MLPPAPAPLNNIGCFLIPCIPCILQTLTSPCGSQVRSGCRQAQDSTPFHRGEMVSWRTAWCFSSLLRTGMWGMSRFGQPGKTMPLTSCTCLTVHFHLRSLGDIHGSWCIESTWLDTTKLFPEKYESSWHSEPCRHRTLSGFLIFDYVMPAPDYVWALGMYYLWEVNV